MRFRGHHSRVSRVGGSSLQLPLRCWLGQCPRMKWAVSWGGVFPLPSGRLGRALCVGDEAFPRFVTKSLSGLRPKSCLREADDSDFQGFGILGAASSTPPPPLHKPCGDGRMSVTESRMPMTPSGRGTTRRFLTPSMRSPSTPPPAPQWVGNNTATTEPSLYC